MLSTLEKLEHQLLGEGVRRNKERRIQNRGWGPPWVQTLVQATESVKWSATGIPKKLESEDKEGEKKKGKCINETKNRRSIYKRKRMKKNFNNNEIVLKWEEYWNKNEKILRQYNQREGKDLQAPMTTNIFTDQKESLKQIWHTQNTKGNWTFQFTIKLHLFPDFLFSWLFQHHENTKTNAETPFHHIGWELCLQAVSALNLFHLIQRRITRRRYTVFHACNCKKREKHYGVKTFNSSMAKGHKMVMAYPEETLVFCKMTHTHLSSAKWDTHTPSVSSAKWHAHTYTTQNPTSSPVFPLAKNWLWGNGQGDVKERFEKLTLNSNQH